MSTDKTKETENKETPYQALLRRREELRLQQEKAKNK